MKKIPIRQLRASTTEPSPEERFTIRKVEDILQGSDALHELHRHDFFFILALQKGHGEHVIDFTVYPLRERTLFILRPGQVHRLDLRADCRGYLVEFNTAFYQPKDKPAIQRLRKASHKNHCILEEGRFEKLHAILASMHTEYTNKDEAYRDFIKSSLDLFFIEYIRQSTSPRIASTTSHLYTQDRFEEFLELLSTHITTRKQVAAYTDLMNLSSYQLSEITKSSIGKTPSQLINDRIILEAKRYLLATANQVKDIADILGYEDPSYFSRFFKKQTGQSPEVFRRNLTEVL